MVFGLGRKKKRYLNHVLSQGKLYIHILIDMMIYDVMLNNYRIRFIEYRYHCWNIAMTIAIATKQPVESRNEQHPPYAAKHYYKPAESSSPAQSTCAASQQPCDPVSYPPTPAESSPH